MGPMDGQLETMTAQRRDLKVSTWLALRNRAPSLL